MATFNRKGVHNWGSGKRGFQSVLNDCQQIGLLLIWSQNYWKNSEMQMARQTALRGKQFIKTLQYKLLRQFIQPAKMFY